MFQMYNDNNKFEYIQERVWNQVRPPPELIDSSMIVYNFESKYNGDIARW